MYKGGGDDEKYYLGVGEPVSRPKNTKAGVNWPFVLDIVAV